MESSESYCRPCLDESFSILKLKKKYFTSTKPGRNNVFLKPVLFLNAAVCRILGEESL